MDIRKNGKQKGHAWAGDLDTPTEASLKCLGLLLEETKIDKLKIRAVFATTNPLTIDGKASEESLTEAFLKRAGLDDEIKISDDTWGCGGPAVGVDSMNSWLQNQPLGTYALYVTQDWSTKMVEDRNVEALFSDAVSVSLWTNNSDGMFEIKKIFSDSSTISDEALGIIDGFWKMDGGEVSAQASLVPDLASKKLNINLRDYDIVPHQPNAKLLETMEKIYGVPFHKEIAEMYGNPTCSGVFIALEKVLEDRSGGIGLNIDKDILVIPFGAGGVGGFILSDKK